MPDTLPLQRPSSRPLSSGTWLLRVCLLLGLLFGVLVPLRAQLLPNNWRLEFTNKLGQPDPSCTSQACVQVHQDFLSRLVRVCLFRPVPGSMRQWAAVVNPKDLDLCQEVFLADPNTKTMYLHAPYAVGEGTAIPGMMHIACPDQGSCGGPNQPSCGGSRFKPRSSPDMCNSVFFTPYSEKPGYRILQTRMVQMALSMSNFAPVVAQHLQAKAMMSPEQVMAAYRLAFENAKTLEAIRAFEWEYANSDPEGLIAQLATVKRALQVQEYQRRYEQLSTPEQLQGFVDDYANDDPDGRLPDVRRRLALEQQKAKAEQEQRAAQLKIKDMQELERQIVLCKRSSEAARQAIARENEVGRISGYVNKRKLHEAGDWILSCQEQIKRQYSQYRQAGGKKALAEIN